MRRRPFVNENLCLSSAQASIRILREPISAGLDVEFRVEVRRKSRARSSSALSQSPEHSGLHTTTIPREHSYHLRKGFVELATHPQAVQQHGQLSRDRDNRP